ncbi:CoA-binding protein [Thermodesulfatator atlanticus]|uniref:CoA-binding protein n=1 Tax=Thermodesulfatator atlanticus TaxID=501497 RepID=UPI0003B3ACD8|nr:CoA-binding protein [Thermodesulfatator atlanticus]
MKRECTLPNYTDISALAKEIVSQSKNIAIVGASAKEERPSFQVMKYLLEHGFKVVPVNPGQKEILGQKCYRRLSEIPAEEKIDTVIIFRRADQVPPIVREALSCGIKNIWLQEGIVSEEAQDLAKKAGGRLVMNLCFKKVHQLISQK